MATNTAIYNGGSFDTTIANGFRKTNADLIKSNLLTHLFTKKGERLMMPNFGTNIHRLLFEPLDNLLRERLAEEIQAVIDYDPRVELLSMTVNVDEDRHKITINVLLRFIELEIVDNLQIDLQKE